MNTLGALVHTEASRVATFKAIEPQLKSIEAPLKPPVGPVRALLGHEPHEFPEASKAPALPLTIRDETLEFYAFVFCQGGFRQLGMTFEQFLLVAAVVKPADLPATREEDWTL